MMHTNKSKFESRISNCKSELLNHTLQNEVVSPHIKSIKLYLDECLDILQEDWKDAPKIKRNRSSKINGDAKNNILFFAYCMSKWDYQFTNSVSGHSFNQSEAFEYLAKKLKLKVATLRNYRDVFDNHVDQKRSNRRGWKKPLNLEFGEIIQKFDSRSEADLIDTAKNILDGL